MAKVSEASVGCSAAREISHAEVPMRAMEAPMAPAPRTEACTSRPVATRAMPRVRPTGAGRSGAGSKTVPLMRLRAARGG